MKNKRILSAVTAALVSVSVSLSVTAETVESGVSATDERNAEIASCLGYVESQKELWGIGDVNFEDLYLGEAVQTYEYLVDGFSPCVPMYPLIYGENIVLWAIEVGESYQITTELTGSINDYISTGTEFSIVYADDGSYLYTSGEFIMLSEYDCGDTARMALSGYENGDGIVLSNLSDSEPLNYYGIEAFSTNTLYECDIDYVGQDTNKLCWAASCASIINYKKGTNYTSTDIAQRYLGNDYNKGQSASAIPDVLASYGLSYSYRASAPSAAIVLKNIKADYPVYGSFAGINSSLRHGCVLYGINTSTETFYIMDPLEQAFTYMNPSSSGVYSFYSGGYTWELDRGVCHAW